MSPFSFFSRRTFVWRCVIISFLIYVFSIGAFIPLLSSTPKTYLDQIDLAGGATVSPTVVTRRHSPSIAPSPAVVRRPLDTGPAVVVAAEVVVSTKPTTKKPTALEVLHKNMTLHKANMSDLLKHVKAAVANHSSDNDTSLSNRKVNTLTC